MRRRPVRGDAAVPPREPLPLLALRKHSGAAALTQGRVPRERFRLVSGSELVAVYRPPGGGMAKAFCSVCGSSLFGGTWPEGPEVSVRFGALDGDPGIRPQYRSFVDSRAVWDQLPDDGLPRFPGVADASVVEPGDEK